MCKYDLVFIIKPDDWTKYLKAKTNKKICFMFNLLNDFFSV